MDTEIGFAAGDVYEFLKANGPATVNQLRKATGRKQAELYEAIGWLAREGKVERMMKGRMQQWLLAEEGLA